MSAHDGFVLKLTVDIKRIFEVNTYNTDDDDVLFYLFLVLFSTVIVHLYKT